MIRIFIAAGIRLYREGLVEALARVGAVNVVGFDSCGPDVVPRIVELGPDVILLDMGRPQSYATARELQRAIPEIPVVAFGISNSESELLGCAEVGIIGYVTDDVALKDLIPVIEGAARGEAICSPTFARNLVRKLATLAVDGQPELLQVRLTKREREIVALLEHDLSNKEIASCLGVEVTTVKNHVHNLLEKLSVHRRSEITRTLKQTPRTVAAMAASGPRRRRDRSGRAS